MAPLENGSLLLQEEKLAQEIERLKLDNSQLKKPAWRNPTFVLAVGGLLLSALGNSVQFIAASRAEAKAAAELGLAERRWTTERQKLDAEIADLVESAKISKEQRVAILADLQEVNRDIKVWENAIFKDRARLLLEEAQLDQYVLDQRPEMAEAQRKNIKLTKDGIDLRNGELQPRILRRSELERFLSCP